VPLLHRGTYCVFLNRHAGVETALASARCLIAPAPNCHLAVLLRTLGSGKGASRHRARTNTGEMSIRRLSAPFTRSIDALFWKGEEVQQQATGGPSDRGDAAPAGARLVQREASDRVQAIGLHEGWIGDLYHHMLSLPWAPFLAGLSLVYVGLNLLFALAYLLGDGAIANARRGAFWDAFFFSVETLSTIGYGQMSPATLYGNIVMTVEALVGLMLVAVAAGLMFARFSRPTARVLFSKVAVVAPFNGVPTLSLRLANVRRNQILDAQVSVTLVRDEHTAEGEWIRRFYDLKLARQRSPIFAMTFTVMHAIDAASPLWNATSSSLAAESVEIVVTVTGLDETISRSVHARTSYLAHEILWNHSFADVFTQTEDGHLAIDYRRFHNTEPVQSP
jgi:inward rectifier potassium channel